MDFTKVQSVGNDFVLVESREDAFDWKSLALAICDRHYGVGSDGLLVLLPSLKADFRMRIFNADGSEAEACGNGLRCLVHHLITTGMAPGEMLSIETYGGIRIAQVTLINGSPNIKIGMGVPILEPDEIPVEIDSDLGDRICGMISNYPVEANGKQLNLNFVSMGNPHAVCFIDDAVADFPLNIIGPMIERNSMFPKRTNLEVVRVINHGTVEMRVWERGVGETLACGTGACAVAVAGWILGRTGNRVDIKLPGGQLTADWCGQGEVYLSGRAETVFNGSWLK
ncbi:diaminopimelate epimerase [Dehalogenimonas alkenigignens]|uniref:Diaminopimelate epimerase n=1 Tax=Dehalogenimonas alkenigignens TaxID=1217799 RepID=A0A0W0GJB9_9CHLR|nr:diaminopimelate epimerase [Dehalogenimonas alkenigignens]KTB48638.1 diaminopimelate epimerase [Dehalogenimonas alkenigignens]PVV84928.1 diaminopimelate epimerase [Dehalogenimonas alkenigignens]